tara:strand:+ start:3844 stop:5076 length:1233 start_codon:yes stop_codon:yes gene_type:complete
MFTDKQLKGLKPKDKKYTVTETTGERGESRLQLNIYPTGIKKFQIQYYLNKQRKRYEFGKFSSHPGDLSLRDARIAFAELSAYVKNGRDPKNPDKVDRRNLGSLGTLYLDFMKWYKSNRKLASYETVSSYLATSFENQVDLNMAAADFTPDMCRSIIYPVYNRGSKDAALGLKSALSMMFKYGIDYDNGPERFGKPKVFDITTNPTREIILKHQKTAGKRFLTPEEVRTIWHAKDMHPRFNRYFRLNMALAGQRIIEVAHAFDHEFDLKERLFEIPVERIKVTPRGNHVVPLSDFAIEQLKECMKFRSQEGRLFPSARNPKQSITLRSLRNGLISWLANNPEFEWFINQDIRRTCKTLMSKAGVNIEHRDMLQQHYKKDVATISYDRYDYLTEKRQAMEQWTNYLKQIVG